MVQLDYDTEEELFFFGTLLAALEVQSTIKRTELRVLVGLMGPSTIPTVWALLVDSGEEKKDVLDQGRKTRICGSCVDNC